MFSSPARVREDETIPLLSMKNPLFEDRDSSQLQIASSVMQQQKPLKGILLNSEKVSSDDRKLSPEEEHLQQRQLQQRERDRFEEELQLRKDEQHEREKQKTEEYIQSLKMQIADTLQDSQDMKKEMSKMVHDLRRQIETITEDVQDGRNINPDVTPSKWAAVNDSNINRTRKKKKTRVGGGKGGARPQARVDKNGIIRRGKSRGDRKRARKEKDSPPDGDDSDDDSDNSSGDSSSTPDSPREPHFSNPLFRYKEKIVKANMMHWAPAAMVKSDVAAGQISVLISESSELIFSSKQYRKSMDVSQYSTGGMGMDKPQAVVQLSTRGPSFDFKHLDKLNPATFHEVRVKVYLHISSSPRNILENVHNMFNDTMKELIETKLTSTCSQARYRRNWMLDGLVLTGHDEQMHSLSNWHYDRYMCMLYILCFGSADYKEADIVLKQIFDIQMRTIKPLQSGVLTLWEGYGRFDQQLQNVHLNLQQDIAMLQFMTQQAVQVQHKGKLNDRIEYGATHLYLTNMTDLGAGQIVQSLIRKSEFPNQEITETDRPMHAKTVTQLLEAITKSSEKLAKKVGDNHEELALVKRQSVENLKQRPRLEDKNSKSSNSNDSPRKREREHSSDKNSSESLSKTRQYMVRRSYNNKPEGLKLMTKSEYSGLNDAQRKKHKMFFLDPQFETAFLCNLKSASSYGDYGKIDEHKKAGTKPGCFYEMYLGKGQCQKGSKCTYEHDERKLVPEKKALLKRLQEELARVPASQLHVMEDIDSGSDSTDDSDIEEDSDRNADDTFDVAFAGL